MEELDLKNNRPMGLELETVPYAWAKGKIYCQTDQLPLERSPTPFSWAARFQSWISQKFGNPTSGTQHYVSGPNYRTILPNQGQAYLDQNLFEACTPKCSSPLDLMMQERILRHIISTELRKFNEEIIRACGSGDSETRLFLLARGSDPYHEHTNGCHENYFTKRRSRDNQNAPLLTEPRTKILTPFLLARTILGGKGQLYCGRNTNHRRLSFGISQRLPFVEMTINSTSTSDRPLILDRDESLADGRFNLFYERLQLSCGEHNQTPWYNFINPGLTCTLLDMLEDGYFNHEKLIWLSSIANACDYPQRTTGHRLYGLPALINQDIRCQTAYGIREPFEGQIKLYEILEHYTDRMMDYLEKGSYDGEMTTNMRRQKLEAVRMAQKAIDSFRRSEHSPEILFEQVGNIEWITRLKWVLNLLREDFDIEIGENELELLSDIDTLLWRRSAINHSSEFVEQQKDILLYDDLLWDAIDKESTYALIEDGCYEDWGVTINPLVIDGGTIELSAEGRENEIPMNPPNSTLPSKKLWDLMQEFNLQDILSTDWKVCRILPASHKLVQKLERLFQDTPGNSRAQRLIGTLFAGGEFKFDNPLESENEDVENFIRKVRSFLIPPKDREW
ncbi:MAG: proteasome accessory factor PafA2 family protein [Candidatus Portnoybacteria bacterium]|nr:proteasome accessory factor PafA2 family protein [Candidatus Portnoybacteria bacterium]